MVPTLNVGDFIVISQIPDINEVTAASPPTGDILVFIRNNDYIVHRAVGKYFDDGEWEFVTKGDNNKMEDGRPANENDVIGKVVGNIPVFGYFPLFLKTTRGLALIIILMIVVFFADTILPDKRGSVTGGTFPWMSLLPFLVSPLVLLSFWYIHEAHFELEVIALISWYTGCLVSPLSFDDDDTGLMFWLYHFVLTIIPVGFDMVWWLKRITPSMWWTHDGGSTVPIRWFLQQESQFYIEAFNLFAIMVIPGCILFFGFMAAKRKGIEPLRSLNRRFRRAENNVNVEPDSLL
jgi:signal peptidase I